MAHSDGSGVDKPKLLPSFFEKIRLVVIIIVVVGCGGGVVVVGDVVLAVGLAVGVAFIVGAVCRVGDAGLGVLFRDCPVVVTVVPAVSFGVLGVVLGVGLALDVGLGLLGVEVVLGGLRVVLGSSVFFGA